MNSENFSGLFLIERDFKSLLGDVYYDANGQIASAKALKLELIGIMNGTAARQEKIQADSALGEYVSTLQGPPWQSGFFRLKILGRRK